MERYGLIPEFKAGLHYGNVTIGEVGVIKKEIVFTGDVLNTTARIQEMCNTYNVSLLVSKTLIDSLQIDSRYTMQVMGEIALRGKQSKNILYNLQEMVQKD